MEDVNELSRTELDSHANMPVIGRNAYILSKIGETVDVPPFTPDYKPISVELVDNRILSKVQKSFWSCTHVNSCQNNTLYINLHIVLNILSKATSNIQESRKSIKRLKR